MCTTIDSCVHNNNIIVIAALATETLYYGMWPTDDHLHNQKCDFKCKWVSSWLLAFTIGMVKLMALKTCSLL